METNFSKHKIYFELMDQIFEIERKVEMSQEQSNIVRNVNRMKSIFESSLGLNEGFTYHNPLNEPYNETRLDLEASIAGESSENLYVSEVIKPIIRYKNVKTTLIARKGVVVVESKNKKGK